LRYIDGADELTSLSKQVSLKTGMKNGSASIYLNFLANLVNEKPNTRALKFEDVEYLMSKIRTELEMTYIERRLNHLRNLYHTGEKIFPIHSQIRLKNTVRST